MVWEPYALAVFFGLVVSTAIYLVVMWPQVEPLDGDDLATADALDADASESAMTAMTASDARAIMDSSRPE